MASVIDDYVAALRRDLDFDRALARRVAEEVEAHLWEAAEADPEGPSPAAQSRVVVRFGLAREISAQFAADTVSRESRRSWIALLATVAVTFVAMRLRVVWLGDLGLVSPPLAPFIDRYAFIATLIVGSVGWFAFRRSLLPLAVCLGALAASIAAGVVRAGLFVDSAPTHVLLAAAMEFALIGLLAFHVLRLGRSLVRTAMLRRVE